MKKTEKKKPVPTIPQGVWESSHTDQPDGKAKTPVSPVTDLQGNGYPNASTINLRDESCNSNTDKLSATAKTFLDTHINSSQD